MANSAPSASGSSRGHARLATRAARPIPLIECPYHPKQTITQLIAGTAKNKGKKFYRCMKNAMTPQACRFFKWEKECIEYLVDNGFMDDPESWDASATSCEVDVRAAIAKLTEAVGSLNSEVRVLKGKGNEEASKQMMKQPIVGTTEMMKMLVAMNVVAILASVLVVVAFLLE